MVPTELASTHLKTQSLGSQVTAFFEARMTAGALQPGDRLPSERGIAELLDVSRVSARQGLYELELRGLIERRHGRAATVIGPSVAKQNLLGVFSQEEREIAEVIDLRQSFEPSVAMRAAERATPANLDVLTKILEKSSAELSVEESVRLDREFHRQIAIASQNSLLETLIVTTADWMQNVREKSHKTYAGRDESIRGHRRILDAITSRDPVAAEQAMRDHIEVLKISSNSDMSADEQLHTPLTEEQENTNDR